MVLPPSSLFALRSFPKRRELQVNLRDQAQGDLARGPAVLSVGDPRLEAGHTGGKCQASFGVTSVWLAPSPLPAEAGSFPRCLEIEMIFPAAAARPRTAASFLFVFQKQVPADQPRGTCCLSSW